MVRKEEEAFPVFSKYAKICCRGGSGRFFRGPPDRQFWAIFLNDFSARRPIFELRASAGYRKIGSRASPTPSLNYVAISTCTCI